MSRLLLRLAVGVLLFPCCAPAQTIEAPCQTIDGWRPVPGFNSNQWAFAGRCDLQGRLQGQGIATRESLRGYFVANFVDGRPIGKVENRGQSSRDRTCNFGIDDQGLVHSGFVCTAPDRGGWTLKLQSPGPIRLQTNGRLASWVGSDLVYTFAAQSDAFALPFGSWGKVQVEGVLATPGWRGDLDVDFNGKAWINGTTRTTLAKQVAVRSVEGALTWGSHVVGSGVKLRASRLAWDLLTRARDARQSAPEVPASELVRIELADGSWVQGVFDSGFLHYEDSNGLRFSAFESACTRRGHSPGRLWVTPGAGTLKDWEYRPEGCGMLTHSQHLQPVLANFSAKGFTPVDPL